MTGLEGFDTEMVVRLEEQNKFLKLRNYRIQEYITYDRNSLNVSLLSAQVTKESLNDLRISTHIEMEALRK